jgi:DNA-binding beta-propeller fold protein YncE
LVQFQRQSGQPEFEVENMMAMKFFSLLKSRILSALCAGLLLSMGTPPALATDLPSGVLNYLRQKDPHVKVRFDGLVLFSNGESYVPVIPQDPAFNADSQQVVSTIPAKAAYPDLIQFDNNFFLMRLIQTASGRLTFPKMVDYPIQLKEGLLPQDFVMPTNLFIPVELKVLLGALPYSPSFTPSQTPVTAPAATILQQSTSATNSVMNSGMARVTYVFDLSSQRIMAIEPVTGRKQGEVALDCVPSSLRVAPEGKLLFVPCLSTNELVVVDTGSNLVKTRVDVGQRPDGVLYLDQTQDVVVSNRYSPFLSLVNSNNLTGEQKINLPGNGGAMSTIAGARVPKLVVADAFKPQIYLVDINTRVVEKTLAAIPDISALKAFQDPKGGLEIWAVSRTKKQLIALDGLSGKILKTFDVGEKPVDMAAYDGKLFVVSAGSDRVDVIDRLDQSKYGTIPLETESFPSGIAIVPSEKRAYITLAASQNFLTLNLTNLQVDKKVPVEFRASMIAMTPDKAELEQNAARPSGLDRANRLVPQEPATIQGAEVLKVPAQKPVEPVQAEKAKRKKSEKALKPETHQLNIKKQKEKKPKEAKRQEPATAATGSGAKNDLQPLAMPPQQFEQQGLPGQASGKIRLKLGRDKEKAKSPAVGQPVQAQVQPAFIQVQANQDTKPVAMPLDLQINDPAHAETTGASGGIQSQGDVLKE